ncbi:MAG: glycine zipper domain-containing protein [Arenicellales bacterium]
MKNTTTLIISISLFALSSAATAQTNDPIADSKKICHHQAAEKSGYDPTKSKSGSTVAKGTGVGAAGGATVRAIQGKSLLKGAAIGAAAGAAAGGLKKNQDKKSAVTGEANYKTEYDNCLRSRGLVPENVR